jgi:hypothetical protein
MKKHICLAIIASALGFFVDLYDIIILSIVRSKSLLEIGIYIAVARVFTSHISAQCTFQEKISFLIQAFATTVDPSRRNRNPFSGLAAIKRWLIWQLQLREYDCRNCKLINCVN